MRSSDVFQGDGESRLTRLLLDDPVDQSENLDGLVDALQGIGADLAEIQERLAVAEARFQIPATNAGSLAEERPEQQPCEYLVYLSTPDGYLLTTFHGPVPASGDTLDVEGDPTVLNVGRSPLPDDPRPCVFALPSGQRMQSSPTA